MSPCILTYSSWAFSFCLVVLHCAYLIVLVPVCYVIFYSFLKMGLFEKVVSIFFNKKNCTCFSIFDFFFFFFVFGGVGGAHLGNNVFGCILCHVLFLRKFLKKEKLILGHCKVNFLQKNQLVSFGWLQHLIQDNPINWNIGSNFVFFLFSSWTLVTER